MGTQHTKGPWRAAGEHVFSVEGRLTVTRCDYGGENERHANARLIAASPDLLDLAYQYLSDLRYPPTGDSLQRRIERAKAIIVKATGQ
jgi:hypothetical protein